MSNAFRQYGTFLLVPCVVFVFSLLLNIAAGPYWLAANFDPAYEYLVNGLYMLKGIAPQDVAHPGTPLQILCCVVCWLFNICRSSSYIVTQVLISPEHYLHLVFAALSLLFFLSSFGLAVYVFRKTGDKLAAVLTQLPALSYLALKSWDSSDPVLSVVANVYPETLLMSVVNVFNICLFMAYFAKTQKDGHRASLLSGFVSGLGVATKVTFFPLLLVPLIVLSIKNKMLFFVYFSISFLFWTIPILSKYHHLFKWLIKIFTHTGIYGEGNKGIVDMSGYLSHWIGIITAERVFSCFLFLSLLMVFRKFITKKWDKSSFFLLAITLGILFQFAIVAKHPGMHYLLPGLGLFSSLLVFFYLSGPGSNVTGRQIVFILILVSTLAGAWRAMERCSNLENLSKEILSFHEYVHKKYKNCIFLPYYRSSGQNWALFFGDSTGNKPRLGNELDQLYPHSLFYNLWGGLENYKEKVSMKILLDQGHCVLLEGDGKLDFSSIPFNVHLLEKGKFENVYQLIIDDKNVNLLRS